MRSRTADMPMKRSKGEYRLKPSLLDAAAIAFVLLLALGTFLILGRQGAGSGRRGEIILGGEVVCEIDLDTSPDREIELGGEYPCTIAVRDGEIGFVRSTCPNGDCVRSGMLKAPGDTAACLPDRAVVRVIGDGVDAVVR